MRARETGMDEVFNNNNNNRNIEIQVDILSRLPMKKLLAFKAVCKSWSDLIGEPYYVDLKEYHNSIASSYLAETCRWVILPRKREIHILLDPAPAVDDALAGAAGSNINVLKMVEYGQVLESHSIYNTKGRKKLVEYCVLGPHPSPPAQPRTVSTQPPRGFVATYGRDPIYSLVDLTEIFALLSTLIIIFRDLPWGW